MEAKHRHGLILGKFLPPHEGHLFLVREALKQCERLTILVCSLEAEPIPGAQRFAWMRELCPEAEVVHVQDENPSYPDEHPDFWNIWIATIRRHVADPIDVVFTSEEYGDELAARLEAVHHVVDTGRKAVPVSGTAVRSHPFANWSHIPRMVRPWFVKRVVLTGSECTGKSTLAPLLAKRFDTVWVPEYGREFVDQHGLPKNAAEMELVARGQIEAEERAAREANKVLILDTDLFTTAIYSEHYFGSVAPWIEAAAVERQGDLYLLADIDVPWEADGQQRDRGDRREEMQELFRQKLREHRIDWVDLRGSLEQRVATATAAVTTIVPP